MSAASSVGSSVGSSVASSVTVGSAGWTPNALGLNVRERALEGGLAYESSLLSNLPVLKSLEPYGTYRAPRQGRCWLFDGSNDYADLPTNLSLTGDFTFYMRCNQTTALNRILFGTTNTTANWLYNLSATQFEIRNDAGTQTAITHGHTFALNETYSIFVVRSGSTVSIYKNTTVGGTTGTVTGTVRVGRIGSYSSLGLHFAGKMFDIRIFNVAKDATAIAAIYAGDDDTTGLLAHYPCNEELGTVGYDIGPNARHLTLTNITQATFHATDTGITKNRNNLHGYRLSGSVYIPKRLASDLAADGNSLTATGQAPYPVATESVCLTFDGSSVYADMGAWPSVMPTAQAWSIEMLVKFAALSGDMTLISIDSSTGIRHRGGSNQTQLYYGGFSGGVNTKLWNWTPVVGTWYAIKVTWNGVDTTEMFLDGVSLGTQTLSLPVNPPSALLVGKRAGGTEYMNGSISYITFTTGSDIRELPLQDGPGSANLNRNVAYYKSDGTYGVVSNAIVNGTVANIWANRCPRVRDWCIENGGRLGTNGEFILGIPDSSLCADGNAKTLTAGKHGNPYSRLNTNPFTAAELNGRNLPSALAPGGSLAGVTPSDSAFIRSAADGDDRLLITKVALTGSDLTKAQEWVD